VFTVSKFKIKNLIKKPDALLYPIYKILILTIQAQTIQELYQSIQFAIYLVVKVLKIGYTEKN
jgi:hypothetical protein